VALTKAQRVERARNAAKARWGDAGDDAKHKQRLHMVEGHAKALGYRLVPITDSNESKEGA
jgi:hypothetical protein